MLIGNLSIRRSPLSLVLRDIDGSEQSLSLQDALGLLDWLQSHEQEIKQALEDEDTQKAPIPRKLSSEAM